MALCTVLYPLCAIVWQKLNKNNVNVNATRRARPDASHQQQRRRQTVEREQSEDVRQKMEQWCEWNRRYGVLPDVCSAEKLRRTKVL